MRVLIVFSSSGLGGAERSLTRMAIADRDNPEIEYRLATLDGKGPWSEWAEGMGVGPLVFGEREEDARHARYGMRALVSLIRFVRSDGIDIVYAIGLRASFLLRLCKRSLRGARLVHGVRWNPGSRSRLDRAFRFVERKLDGSIDLYIVNSGAAQETLAEKCGIDRERIRVIHNGINELPRDLAPLRLRPPHVVTVANMAPRKGHLEYLEVVAQVVRKVPEAQFYFVGRDDMNGRVQNAIAARGISENIHCVGMQRDIGPYLRRARVFALPSLWNEGCPTSILEAMAFQVPVVAHAIDGIPELIEDGVSGILVPLNDRERMEAGILRLLDGCGYAESMGTEGRKRVEAEFRMERCAARHFSAFREIV